MIDLWITLTLCITLLCALIATQRHIRMDRRQAMSDQWEKRMHLERMKLLEIDHAKANTATAEALAQIPRKALSDEQQRVAEMTLKRIQEHDE